ncbi:DUF1456 family protein [Carnobacterium viridans]|uniref:Uncharacterized conserved protein YehS, DUF1456 family n=1 Tax=Carnobacterium viridans TaxID=174587 RepID=A0A1H1A6Y5_9LACT|nr:DUF1456 family protein [Carnobacterium viridans]UDE94281.1 DUF1456 family protein [Carnobacterium viridans]SDQ35261.1 Uncharacterized conserved protein YehS, DUF1456 family [Carnobacterium viridans]
MNNNDRLVRLRYALDIKDTEMVEIFKLGGLELTKEDVKKMLTKSKNENSDTIKKEEFQKNDYVKDCSNQTLESFLNGLIIFKRGRQESAVNEPEKLVPMVINDKNVNNMLLKKIKIALSLTSEDMLGVLGNAGVQISKSELSAVLRKEGHRNYKECGDRYARNFLKGLAIAWRE